MGAKRKMIITQASKSYLQHLVTLLRHGLIHAPPRAHFPFRLSKKRFAIPDLLFMSSWRLFLVL